MPSRRPRAPGARRPEPIPPIQPRDSSSAKIRRWIDLLAALLVRRMAATFDELARDVPAYARAGQTEQSRMRMFERDKDELRAFGIPIETTTDGRYRLQTPHFYLPYLCATAPTGVASDPPARVERDGYRRLKQLTFAPEELAAVVEAGRRAGALGDPLLAADAESALRKLAFDLPLDSAERDATADATVLPPRPRAADGTFATLGDALMRRKLCSFDYHAMSTDRTERRTVEPYGLIFLGSHWYLVARDRARDDLRTFRLSRIANVRIARTRLHTGDYRIPDSFDLRAYARSRQAWELGDDDVVEAIVEMRRESGAARAAARLGAPVGASQRRRAFRVRRVDAFARWLLSFAGDLVPVSPASVVTAYRDLARRTLALYADRHRASAR